MNASSAATGACDVFIVTASIDRIAADENMLMHESPLQRVIWSYEGFKQPESGLERQLLLS